MTTTIASHVGPVALPEKTDAAPNNDNKPPAAAIAAIIMTPTGRFGLDGDCMAVRTSSDWSDKSVPIVHLDEPLRTMGNPVKLEGVTGHTLLNFLTYLSPPPTMPKNVTEKLMIKEGQRFLLLNEPSNYRRLVGRLPNKVTISTEPNGQYDVIQVFVASKNELNQRLPGLKTSLASDGIVWVTYPKGSSKMKTDINSDR